MLRSGTRHERVGRARGDSGISLVVVALMMVAICGVAALAIDLGNARQVRRGVQGGVDAAALAAAQDLPLPTNDDATTRVKQSQARNQAMIYATRNMVSDSATPPSCPDTNAYTCTGSVGDVDLTVTTPWDPEAASLPADPGSAAYLGFVHVRACRPTPTFFSGVLQQESPTVCREAVGRFTQTGGGFDFGLVATDPSACGALTFAGNSATTLTVNGAVMVNSDCDSGNTQALDGNGSTWRLNFVDDAGDPVEGYIGVVGGATLNPCDPETNSDCTVTLPTTGIAPFGDPLAGLIPPPDPGGTAQTCDNNGGRISPGRYSECQVSASNAALEMEPGIYYVEGDFRFNGGDIRCVDDTTTMKCTGTDPAGVLIFVTGSSSEVTLTGNGVVDLPPYSMSCTEYYTGTCYDGLSIWQTGPNEATINGTNDFSLGSVYIPNANLKANGNGGSEAINITGIVVAKTVGISGTFDFNILVPPTATDVVPETDLGLEK